ncbi:DUF397 domain-containing protein [Streptomyces sp. NPDC050504]|uniref:DUF397 domain-containing protein n=1 Tax=Streptomyces sp. NPDC050504 TaxID=3365618 RepID=UPI00379DF3CF
MSNTQAPRETRWVSSTYSDGQGGQCVQWAPEYAAATGRVPVRDSKTPAAPHFTVTATAWSAFVDFARHNG